MHLDVNEKRRVCKRMDACCGNEIWTAACDGMAWDGMVKSSAERELYGTVCVKNGTMVGSIVW